MLGQSALSEPVDLNSQQSSVNLVSTLPGSGLLDQNCHQLQIFALSSVAVNKKDLIMESASPPTQTELSHFNRARVETTNPAKQRQQLKVRFGKVLFLFLLLIQRMYLTDCLINSATSIGSHTTCPLKTLSCTKRGIIRRPLGASLNVY